MTVKSVLVAAVLSLSSVCMPASAATLTEDFEAPFPAWESDWFGTQSNAANYLCNAVRGCANRGNNPDGLWIVDLVNGNAGPINVVFNSGFGTGITSFALDIASFTSTLTLRVYDSTDSEIYAAPVIPTAGAFTDPGVYDHHVITSATGISRFLFDGTNGPGNTSVDNIVVNAAVAAIPEPSTYALMLAGLGLVGFVANRRRKAQIVAA